MVESSRPHVQSRSKKTLNIHFYLLISGDKAKSFLNNDMFKKCKLRPLSQPYGANTPRSVFGALWGSHLQTQESLGSGAVSEE